jgi:hypothetical protein
LMQNAPLGSIPPPASLPIQGKRTTGDTPTVDIVFPIIRIQRLEHFPLLDYYWDDYQTLFQINETRCCREHPFPQESVYVSVFLLVFFFLYVGIFLCRFVSFSLEEIGTGRYNNDTHVWLHLSRLSKLVLMLHLLFCHAQYTKLH